MKFKIYLKGEIKMTRKEVYMEYRKSGHRNREIANLLFVKEDTVRRAIGSDKIFLIRRM